MRSTPLALAALVLLPLVAAQLASGCDRQYTVQAGDYCDSISAAHNVSTYQLAAVNAGNINSECTNLYPGQVVCLGVQGQDCNTTYTVQFDDTCDDIADDFGLNATIFGLNNPQLDEDCTNLYVGEVVCVSPTVEAPPLPPSGSLPTAVPSSSASAIPWCD